LTLTVHQGEHIGCLSGLNSFKPAKLFGIQQELLLLLR
jgi:hypothetical protein